MNLPIYQVDAFTSALFKGNPAAVMPLEHWLADDLLQSIAAENNLSETAFFVRAGDGFELRWFTPEVEVDLCGHATLAVAHVLVEQLGDSGEQIRFHTKSGLLTVSRDGDALTLDFPATELESTNVDVSVCDALGAIASEAYLPAAGSGPLLCVYEFESDIARLAPDFRALQEFSERPVVVTAPGDECDVVSRFFGPQVGVDEDPVTGSAHCSVVPYWVGRLGRSSITCRQISRRGGELDCELRDGRVLMRGRAVTFMRGEVELPE